MAVTFEWTCGGCQLAVTRRQECLAAFNVLDTTALPLTWHTIDGQPYCPECFARYPGVQLMQAL